MNRYEIIRIDNGDLQEVLVLSTSYVSPLGSLPIIEQELEGHQGEVLFDLLLSNGFASNRFLVAQFDGNKFDVNSFKAVESISPSIKEKAGEFYREHPEYLENSILPTAQKFLIKKGQIS